MIKSFLKFAKRYKQLTLVIVVIITSLILDLTGNDKLANLILATCAIVSVIPLAWGMIETLRTGAFGVDVLAITAIVTSVALGEYWAGIIIVLMLTGGEALEDYAEGRAKAEVTALLKQKPRKAHIIRKNMRIDVKVSEVEVGDKVVILPGEVVPVDGNVFEGASSFDESSLTGESMPVTKNVGELILSGSVNIEGEIVMTAVHSAADSQYEQIIKLVQSASASQSPFVRLADRYSIPFTVIAFMIAGTAWVLSGDPVRFLEVIVVATPCPLLLGAPIALVSGMSRAAKHGVIVKTGSALERLAEVQTVGFDKTGTLTQGLPEVDNIIALGKHSKDNIIALAVAIGSSSTHVLSRAIVSTAEEMKLKVLKAKHVQEKAGHGLVGRLQGKTITVGRLSLLEENDINIPSSLKAEKIGQTVTFVASNNELVGYITFIDKVRPESKSMMERLKSLGIKHTLMVTGDNATTASKIAEQVGIDQVESNCLPADKIHAVEGVKHKPVAFVGDGVNDAPVLTAADVGIALGARGSTAASESADVVIMLDDISRVGTSVAIARRTFKIARQAILIGIFISVGLMLVFSTGKFKAVQGALIQELVDVTVILYALRAHGPWKSKDKLV